MELKLYQVMVDTITATVFAEGLEDLANELNKHSDEDYEDMDEDERAWRVIDGKLIWTLDDYSEECTVNILKTMSKGVIQLEAH